MREYTLSEPHIRKYEESDNSDINILKKSYTDNNYKINTFKLLNFDTIKNKLSDFRRRICLSFFLSFRDKTFNEEYIKMLKLNNTTLTPCEVKLNSKYEKGNFRLVNNLLTVSKYETSNNLLISNNNFESELESTKQTKLIKSNIYNNNTLAESKDSIITKPNSKIIFEDLYNPIICLDFNLITCKLYIHKNKQKFHIIILGHKEKENDQKIKPQKIYKFKMPEISYEKFDHICKLINKSIILSKGYTENKLESNLNKYFPKEYFISKKDFFNEAKTCDVLLFRSFCICSACQRCITKGEYDHIALLIKYFNDLYVYESTGKDGVTLRRWAEFIYYYWFLIYDKMTFRKLITSKEKMEEVIINNDCTMNKEKVNMLDKNELVKIYNRILNDKVDDFIEQTKGQKYHFSIGKYLCRGMGKKLQDSVIKTNGYFCSELIGAIYYYCGIVSDKRDICNYFPGSFGKKDTIPLNQGYSLSQEYIISFSS